MTAACSARRDQDWQDSLFEKARVDDRQKPSDRRPALSSAPEVPTGLRGGSGHVSSLGRRMLRSDEEVENRHSAVSPRVSESTLLSEAHVSCPGSFRIQEPRREPPYCLGLVRTSLTSVRVARERAVAC